MVRAGVSIWCVMKRFVLAAALALFAAPALAHEHGGGMDHAAHGAASITVGDASISATPGPNAAAYATIVNSGSEADRLVAVKSEISEAAELHEMTMEGEVMKMRAVDGIDIPAGGSVKLESGGMHIMLIGLTAPLEDAHSATLIFVFAKAGEVAVDMPVHKAGAAGGHAH